LVRVEDLSPAVRSKERRVTFIVFMGLAGVAVLKLASHEMWRDELQAWMIVRGSDSLSALFENLRYEGTPPLWHLTLFVASRFSADPSAIQVVNFVVVMTAIAIVLVKAPFRLWLRLLIVLGYFPFFEYLNMSRNYGLGLLFLVVSCAALFNERPRLIAGAAALALLALSSVYGALLASAILVALAADRRTRNSTRPQRLVLYSAIVIVGLAATVWTSTPPGDSGVERPPLGQAAKAMASAPSRALLPVPAAERQFWNHTLLERAPAHRVLEAVATVVILTLITLAFRNHRVALILWVTGAGLVVASQLRYIGAMRHNCTLVLVLVAALCSMSRYSPALERCLRFDRRAMPLLGVVAVLGIQLPRNAAE